MYVDYRTCFKHTHTHTHTHTPRAVNSSEIPRVVRSHSQTWVSRRYGGGFLIQVQEWETINNLFGLDVYFPTLCDCVTPRTSIKCDLPVQWMFVVDSFSFRIFHACSLLDLQIHRGELFDNKLKINCMHDDLPFKYFVILLLKIWALSY